MAGLPHHAVRWRSGLATFVVQAKGVIVDRFVALHRHDTYSLWDGLDLATRAAARAAALGQPALALTNHGNVFGLVEHYRACQEHGIKPILGMEGYITFTASKPASRKLGHITLLVENQAGYQNLMRLVTISQDLFYYKPRFSVQQLFAHADGLLVLSGCPASLFARLVEQGHAEEAERLFAAFARHLRGRFYAEIQHKQPADYARRLVQWAQTYRVPVVFTNDAHYTDPEDRDVHDRMLRLRFRGSAKGEDNPTYGSGFHLLSRREAERLLRSAHPWLPVGAARAALDQTVEIADRVAFAFVRPMQYLPEFWPDPDALLRRLVERAMRAKGLRSRPYVERARREMDVIVAKGFERYFLVCWEVAEWARRHHVLIGPRGSVCGSLVAYLLGITSVDPLVHGTLFERFLHEERTTLPDVDLDVDSRHRDRLLGWVQERFAPYAIPIMTVGRYSAASLAHDLAREYQLSDRHHDEVQRLIDRVKWQRVYAVAEEHVRQADERDILSEIEQAHPGFLRALIKLYNQARYVGQHPGGICFVPEADPTPWLAKIRAKDQWLTTYNFVDIEYLGLVKFDFLGLSAMASIARTLELVRERKGEVILLESIPRDDQALFARFARGDVDGIFQFEPPGARRFLREIEVSSFRELVAATALNRPGVSEHLDEYVEGKREGRRDGPFGETYGAIVFQEDVMLYLRSLGFSWSEADLFIKTVKGSGIQKLTSPAVRAVYAKFIRAEMERGASKKEAEGRIARLTRYSFNRAHATAYALVAYWQAWLRSYYPAEFWCAVLSSENDETKRARYEGAAVRDGCVLLPPHVNGTADYSLTDDGAIQVGLSSIKGVGPAAAEAIVAGGPYQRVRDVTGLPRRQINARVLWALVRAGALLMDEEERIRYAIAYNAARAEGRKIIWQPRR